MSTTTRPTQRMRTVEAFREAAAGPGVLDDATFAPHRTIPWLLLGLAVAVAAFRWVVADGAALEEEVEGVI